MTVLVTGGFGYIGSVVCELLEKSNINYVIIDDLRDSYKKDINNQSSSIMGNFGDSNLLDKIFSERQISAVLHLAASANVPDSVINPKLYYINNVVNTLTLLNKMVEYNVNNIIFSSTAAVYGSPKYQPIDELHKLNPINAYGSTKLVIENAIREYNIAYGIKYINFRYFCAAGATTINGENRKTKETHLIPLIIDVLVGRKNKISVFGDDYNTKDGTCIRDFVHVQDIAKAHIIGLENIENIFNHTFNIGSEEGYTVLDIISTTEKIFNKKINVEITKPRKGDPESLVASSKKIKKLLDWNQNFDINDIIKSTYNWRKNI